MPNLFSAEEALTRSNAFNLSADQIIAKLAQLIEACSAKGDKKITQSFSKQAVSDAELNCVLQTLRAKGYEVGTIPNGNDATFVVVSWAPPEIMYRP